MEEVVKILREIGFTDSETALYLALLKFGQKPISFISQKAEINRGLGYMLLHGFLEKGLVSKQVKDRVQYFSALEPEQLISYLENRKREINNQQEKIQSLLSQFEALANPLSRKPKIRFFDGAQGVRSLLNIITKEKENSNKEDTNIDAFLSVDKIIKFIGKDSLIDFIKVSTKKNLKIRIIQAKEDSNEQSNLNSLGKFSKDKLKVRHASHDFVFPVSTFIVKNKIAIISSADENFGLILESAEYSDMQKKLFEMLWSSLAKTSIKVGILHSLSGTMAISESSLVDAVLLAIDEVNAKGGVLGKRINPVILDGESNPEMFAKQAEAMIKEHDVCSVFGGWTSASRKTMKPIFEKYNNLLWYPLQYEGLEESSNIIYGGAAPNQQILPAVDWAKKKIGSKFFLIGSDYVFPRSANEIIKSRIEEIGGEVLGEKYLKLGSQNCKKVVSDIKKLKPDVILNTLNGDSNISFFKALRAAGISSNKIPTISFSIGEEEVSRMHPGLFTGDYAAWGYFQSISSGMNKDFITNFQKRYGLHRPAGDPLFTAYISVKLFCKALEKANRINARSIRDAARGLVINAPEGKLKIDSDNLHLHRHVSIGQLKENAQFKIVWSSGEAIKPDPYPKYKSKKEWSEFLAKMSKSWGGNWSKQ